MTDAMYYAKCFFNNLQSYEQKVKAERRTLGKLQARISRTVSSYETGSRRGDAVTAQASHENALLDFSMQCERVEKAQRKYLQAVADTQKVIDAISPELQPLAIDRYINGLKWDRLEIIYNYGRSQLFEHNKKILAQAAEIMKAEHIEIIIEEEATA